MTTDNSIKTLIAVTIGTIFIGASKSFSAPLPNQMIYQIPCTYLVPGNSSMDDHIGWYLEGEHKLDVPKSWTTLRTYKELESYGLCYSGVKQPSAHTILPISVGDPIGKGFVVTSSFGPRPVPCSGCSSYHAGIDVNTPTGTPLVSPAPVEVSCKVDGSGGGIVAEFWYDNMKHQFLHLSDCFPGNRPIGDIFAFTGSTGVGTGPHLDYRVKMTTENGALTRVYPPKEVLDFVLYPNNYIN